MRFTKILACGGLALSATLAYAVAPNLTTVTPAGGQRGTAVEVTLRGERLADTQELFLYGPGITVEKIGETADKVVKATLRIAPDCQLGEHALRVRTASGVSALRLFYVGPLPSVEEKEPNNSAAKAQVIALNSTVQGSIGSEDVDFFAVEVKKDERISVEVEGARLGRTMFDPIVFIHDAAGKQLATSDDTTLLGHDCFTTAIAAADGRYIVSIRDMTYAGNNHVYRMHVGTFARPALAFPLGGRPGETLQAHFLGDPKGEFTQSVTLPDQPTAKFAVVSERDGAAPSPNWLRVVDLPNAEPVAAAPVSAKAPLLSVPAPLAYQGILDKKGEPAFVRFKAKKEQDLEFQVFARRLGSPLDSVITVLDAKGKSLGNNDDAAGNPDSSVRVRLPEDGEYTVKVADQLGRGGPLFAYRVEIRDVAPSLVLSIPDTARYDYETRKSIVVPRGNRFAVLMNIQRESCNEDLTMAFDGLPAGLTMAADTVPGSLSAVPVVFEAAADAPVAGNLLTPAARPTNAEKAKKTTSRYRHGVEWVRIQNDTVYVKSEVDQIAAAVAEEVPFKIRIVEPRVPLVQNGEMNLQIVAERAEGFDEPITLKMLWNPPGVSTQPDITIPKDSSTITYKFSTTNKAEVRKWKTAVVASAPVKGGTAYVSSQLAEVEIAPPFIAGKMDLAKVERGGTAKMICKLEQKVPFEGTAIARLVGLPDKVTAKDVEITKDSKEAVFEIETSDKSPTGITKNIFCSVVLTQAGEPITHVLAAGSILRVDAPKAAKPSIAAAADAAKAPAIAKTKE